ncbi:GUN4 domain-containing protein [Nostoc sp. UHCC 0926]|uniref:GUN4 domain-containing protein n=1 Tax=unclassified Nostoc TaxID=2593658 RepID=UPI0023614B17|nr:GUN4 domain-containing protein [Nostoc sp. UHCC 0926]WDD31465.1 GUN4 domain-containing protein [Nostoc sp. UHCC 0926]
MDRTIVQLDLAKSTKFIENLPFKGNNGEEIRKFLTNRIEELVKNAIDKSITNSDEIEPNKAIVDGYILGFKNTESAYSFVKKFCEDVNIRNKSNLENVEWLFRIGAVKGDVDFCQSSPNPYVGKPFIPLKELAAELEEEAYDGWFFIDNSVYKDFSDDIKNNFSSRWYKNKHNQTKHAWECQMMSSTNPQRKPSEDEDDLRSDRFVDYTQLRDLLKAREWLQANEETLAVMLKATGSQKEGELSSIYIEKLPCTDLHTIDQLWEKYSGEYFGFSEQKRIWERVGKNYNKFGNYVGWRTGLRGINPFAKWITRQELTFNTTFKKGQLPFWDVSEMITIPEFLRKVYERAGIKFLLPYIASKEKFTECRILDRLAKCSSIIEAKGKQPQIRKKISSQPSDDDELKSERNLSHRYDKLRDLLMKRKWNAADKETYSVMLLAVNRNEDERITKDEILEFPCIDLCTIDRLWITYSGEHFGFSVQKKIYQKVGGVLDGKFNKETWKKFTCEVGWRVDQTWTADRQVTSDDIIVQDGYFPRWYIFNELNPSEGWQSLSWNVMTFHSNKAWFNFKNIFSRIHACKGGIPI